MRQTWYEIDARSREGEKSIRVEKGRETKIFYRRYMVQYDTRCNKIQHDDFIYHHIAAWQLDWNMI